MLVLTRKRGEQVVIGDGITLTVVAVRRDRVRLGIDAPEQVGIRVKRSGALLSSSAARRRSAPPDPGASGGVRRRAGRRGAARRRSSPAGDAAPAEALARP